MFNFKKAEKIDENRLPVYEITISDEDETGINLISLVENPAIGIKGMAFSKDESYTMEHYFKEDGDKMVIVGPALVPDVKIRRRNPDGYEYFVVFSKETIEKMVQKFNRYGSNRRINIDHTNKMVDAFITEDWIVEDPVYDKSRKYGFEVPVGTYMVKIKVDDKDFWDTEIKGNGKYGFSIEGLLNQMLVSLKAIEDKDWTIDEVLEDISLAELTNIFGIWDENTHSKCCEHNHHEFAKEGIVHPNCRCDLMLGDFQKSAPYIGKDGKSYPCPICDEAERFWNGRGYFFDVFGNRYTKIDRFPYYVKR